MNSADINSIEKIDNTCVHVYFKSGTIVYYGENDIYIDEVKKNINQASALFPHNPPEEAEITLLTKSELAKLKNLLKNNK